MNCFSMSTISNNYIYITGINVFKKSCLETKMWESEREWDTKREERAILVAYTD